MKLKPQAKTKIIKALHSNKLKDPNISSRLNQKAIERAYNVIVDYAKNKVVTLAYDESLLVYNLLDKLRNYIPNDVKAIYFQNGLLEIVNTIIDQTLKATNTQTENRGGIRAIMNQIRIFESMASVMELDDKVIGVLSIIYKFSDDVKSKPYIEKNIQHVLSNTFINDKDDLEKLFGEEIINKVEELL